MSYSSLGILYDFPERNPSSTIPNTTFTVDVPVEAMVRDAIGLSVPYFARVAPAYVNITWPYVQPLVQSTVQSMLDENVQRLKDEAARQGRQAAIGLSAVVAAALLWRWSRRRA